MAEAAEYDPMDAATEQPATDPQASGSANSADIGMGAGLFETDNQGADSESVTGQTDEADAGQGNTQPDSDNDNADLPDDPKEREAGYLRQSDYTRKTQELSNREKELEQRYQQRLDELERRQQEWVQNQTQAQQGQAQQGQQDASLGQQMMRYAQELAHNPEVSPVDRQGVAFMAQAVSQMEQQAQTIQALQERLEQYEPQIQQSYQAVTQMTEEKRNGLLNRIKQQADEAKSAFGEDVYQRTAPILRPILLDVLNGQPMPTDENGKEMTIPELVARFSGRSLEDVKAAQSGNANGRREAKARASNRSATPSVSASGAGPWSREQAIAAIRETGV